MLRGDGDNHGHNYDHGFGHIDVHVHRFCHVYVHKVGHVHRHCHVHGHHGHGDDPVDVV